MFYLFNNKFYQLKMMKAMFGFEYDDLWKAIIRPPREEYELADLGPTEFTVKDIKGARTDFELINPRKHKLKCSFWEPLKRDTEKLPCVIYLHGNSSSRLEAVQEVKNILPLNMCLLGFDFSGCGQSEGDYISLGWWEIQDVQCVVECLRKSVRFY